MSPYPMVNNILEAVLEFVISIFNFFLYDLGEFRIFATYSEQGGFPCSYRFTK